jgi:hypothetical protein
MKKKKKNGRMEEWNDGTEQKMGFKLCCFVVEY